MFGHVVRRAGRRASRGGIAALVAVWLPATASAQTPVPAPEPAAPPLVLTLDAALDRAVGASEAITIAAAGLDRAEAGIAQARSSRFPQLTGAASYDRTLKSEFSGLFDSTGPPCTPLQANPDAPLADRVTELERAYSCPSGGLFGGSDSGGNTLPFGQANVYRIGLSFSQAVYAGGRIAAGEDQARLRRDEAQLGVGGARAQAALDTAQAFYDAALAGRLVQIAEQSYAQADRALQQATAQLEAGRISEFEQLRARVSRDTLRPDVVRAQATREVALLRLKQLLELPFDQPISIASDLDQPQLPPPARYAEQVAVAETAAAPPRERVSVTQAGQEVSIAGAAVRIAEAERRPAVSLRSDYGLVSYPGRLPAFDDWRTNWTVGVGVSLPILTGGRLRADEASARAGVKEAEARLKLARELAALDAESVRQQLRAARASWEASSATIEQAARAYDIAELRFREGLSTQLELSDSRLLLAQAEATRAQAARDLQVQRIRLALLPDLPLASGSAASATTTTTTTAAAPAATAQRQTGQTGATAAGTTAAAQGGQ
jgi:outer membrane protein TolC